MSKKNQKRKKEMKEQQGCPRPWRQIDDTVVDAHGRIVKAPHGCSWEGDNYNDGAAAAQIIVEAVNNSQQSQPVPAMPLTEEDAKQQIDAAERVSRMYFDIAAEVLGEDEVRRRRDDYLEHDMERVRKESRISQQSQPVPEVGAMADALGDALRSKHAVFLSHTKLVNLVRAMLATAPEQSHPVPDGYVLVPVEPTEDMTDAGYEAYGKGHYTPAILDCYRAMIAAAPKPGGDQ